MQIGPQIRSSIIQMIEGHLADYHKEINEAYENSGRALTFAFGVKLTAAKHGGTQIDVSLNCVRDRLNVKASATVDENQVPLPFGGST